MGTGSLFRECSFKPEEHLTKTPRTGEHGEEYIENYLKVKWKKAWFLTYCKEHGLAGRIEEDSVDINNGAKLVIAKALVYINDKLSGSGVASNCYYAKGQVVSNAVQLAMTQAIGRALSDAGFDVPQVEDEESDIDSVLLSKEETIAYEAENREAVDVDTIDGSTEKGRALLDALSCEICPGGSTFEKYVRLGDYDTVRIFTDQNYKPRNKESKRIREAAELILSEFGG